MDDLTICKRPRSRQSPPSPSRFFPSLAQCVCVFFSVILFARPRFARDEWSESNKFNVYLITLEEALSSARQESFLENNKEVSKYISKTLLVFAFAYFHILTFHSTEIERNIICQPFLITSPINQNRFCLGGRQCWWFCGPKRNRWMTHPAPGQWASRLFFDFRVLRFVCGISFTRRNRINSCNHSQNRNDDFRFPHPIHSDSFLSFLFYRCRALVKKVSALPWLIEIIAKAWLFAQTGYIIDEHNIAPISVEAALPPGNAPKVNYYLICFGCKP